MQDDKGGLDGSTPSAVGGSVTFRRLVQRIAIVHKQGSLVDFWSVTVQAADVQTGLSMRTECEGAACRSSATTSVSDPLSQPQNFAIVHKRLNCGIAGDWRRRRTYRLARPRVPNMRVRLVGRRR